VRVKQAKGKRLMGSIGDCEALGNVVRQNDWKQYTVMADTIAILSPAT